MADKPGADALFENNDQVQRPFSFARRGLMMQGWRRRVSRFGCFNSGFRQDDFQYFIIIHRAITNLLAVCIPVFFIDRVDQCVGGIQWKLVHHGVMGKNRNTGVYGSMIESGSNHPYANYRD